MKAILFAVAGVVSAAAYALTRKGAPASSPAVGSPTRTPATAPEELPDIIVLQGEDMTASTSGVRGIRNNNPGNIDWIKDPAKRWRGMISIEPPGAGYTPRFGVFDTPANGVRAIARELLLSESRGAKTITHLIAGIPQKNGTLADGWAPSNENESATYAKYVADRVGVLADQVISISEHLPEIVAAIIRFENGKQPYQLSDIQAWVRS